MATVSITEFLHDRSPDPRGRMLRDLWEMSYSELETNHDYIQWMFPLDVPSEHVPGAPVVAPSVWKVLANDHFVRAHVLRSLDTMLGFYGLQREPTEPLSVVPSPSFRERSLVWMSPDNHNYKRITRILRSLRLFGLIEEAKALFACVSELRADYADAIGPVTFAFWHEAAA